MKHKKKIIVTLLLIIVLTVVLSVIRVNTYTPIGAVRYECLLHGHIYSALFLKAEEVKTLTDRIAGVYKIKITYAVPYERATDTHLDYWNVIKNKNGTYSASYGVA